MADEQAPGGAGLHDVTVKVLTPVTEEPPIEIDKTLSHKSENLDTLFEHRVLGLRNVQRAKSLKFRASLVRACNFLGENEFIRNRYAKIAWCGYRRWGRSIHA